MASPTSASIKYARRLRLRRSWSAWRSVTSSATPAMRTTAPEASRTGKPRSRIQRVVPSARVMRYSTSKPPVGCFGRAATTSGRSSGCTAASQSPGVVYSDAALRPQIRSYAGLT